MKATWRMKERYSEGKKEREKAVNRYRAGTKQVAKPTAVTITVTVTVTVAVTAKVAVTSNNSSNNAKGRQQRDRSERF